MVIGDITRNFVIQVQCLAVDNMSISFVSGKLKLFITYIPVSYLYAFFYALFLLFCALFIYRRFNMSEKIENICIHLFIIGN